jgi:hypothetical protein
MKKKRDGKATQFERDGWDGKVSQYGVSKQSLFEKVKGLIFFFWY